MADRDVPARGWWRRHAWAIVGVAVAVIVLLGVGVLMLVRSTVKDSKASLYDGRLVAADYWTQTPEILSAGFGFDGIISTPADDDYKMNTIYNCGGVGCAYSAYVKDHCDDGTSINYCWKP